MLVRTMGCQLSSANTSLCSEIHVAHAVFATPANASEAVNKLHAHVFKGSLLSATLKKRLDGLAKAAAVKKAKAPTKQKAGPAPNHASRLIVRNLPFDITEQDLRAIFLPYGPIYSVHIPLASDVKHEDDVKSENGDSKSARPRSKGFAFVWFLSRKDAEKAMQACNGMTVEAGMAEALVSDKQKKKKQRREEKKRKAQEGETVGDAEEEEEEEEERARKKRTIAVDWALSKDKWEAEKAKLEEAQGDGDVDMSGSSEDESESGDESSSDGSSESGSEDEDEDEDEQLGVDEDGSDDSGSEESASHAEDESDEEDEDEKPAKPTLPAPEVGTTVFVRNVPFEATEDELRTL